MSFKIFGALFCDLRNRCVALAVWVGGGLLLSCGAADAVGAGHGAGVRHAGGDARLELPAKQLAQRVHWQSYHHCHTRRGYRSWCHQGETGRRYGDGYAYDWRRGSRYRGRPYYPRRTWRRRDWPREYYRRRYDRDRPYWRRQPYRTGPSIYQAI